MLLFTATTTWAQNNTAPTVGDGSESNPSFSAGMVDLSAFNKGLYIVKITLDDRISLAKIIKN